LGALAIVGAFFLIKDNYKAFKMSHILIMAGVFLSLFATLLFNLHLINPFVWMILGTAGMYLGYLPFNCLYFERMISVYKIKGNVGFVMYIADAFGYLGTVVVLLVKEFIPIKYSWVHFFSFLFYAMGIIGVVLIGLSMMMHAKIKKQTTLI
jgi:hypothetical protein